MQESLFYRLLGITCHNSAFLTISPFVNSVNSFPYFFRNSSAMHKSNKNGLASLLATRQFCWICIWRSAISENLRCIAAYRLSLIHIFIHSGLFPDSLKASTTSRRFTIRARFCPVESFKPAFNSLDSLSTVSYTHLLLRQQ